MKKQISILLLAAGVFAYKGKAQVTPVDPATFSGHYYTETKMNINGKKSNEVDMSFDASTGIFSGLSPDASDAPAPLKFITKENHKKWAEETKIWILSNSGVNATNYGKEMFYYNYITLGTFIEPGVFVLFDANTSMEDKSKVFFAKKDAMNVRIMAKDKSKLGIDKMTAVQKAEDLLNYAVTHKTSLSADEKAMMAVPNETLSKTDKALKAEITSLLNSFRNPEDPSDMICAYTVSGDWKIITNSATGRILGREIMAEMVLKNRNSGNCWRAPYTLTAQYNGSGYGQLSFKEKWNMTKCDCAQVDKNK